MTTIVNVMGEEREYEIRRLADVPTGSKCVIVKIGGHGGLRHRLMEMGCQLYQGFYFAEPMPAEDFDRTAV